MQLARLSRPILDTVLQIHTTGSFQPYYDFNRILNKDSIKNAKNLIDELDKKLRPNIFDTFISAQQSDLYPYIIKLLRLKQFLLDVEGYWNDSVVRLNFVNLCKDVIYPPDEAGYTLNQLISQTIRFYGVVDPCITISYINIPIFENATDLSKIENYLVNLTPITGSKLELNQKTLTRLVESPQDTFCINNFYLGGLAHQVACLINENDILISSRCLWREKETEYKKYIFSHGIHSKMIKRMICRINNYHLVENLNTYSSQFNCDDKLTNNIENKLRYFKLIFGRRPLEERSVPALVFDLTYRGLLDKPVSRVMEDLSR